MTRTDLRNIFFFLILGVNMVHVKILEIYLKGNNFYIKNKKITIFYHKY